MSGLIVAHKTALLERLNSDPVLAGIGHEGVVLERPETYWTLYIDSGARGSDRLGGLPVQATLTYWIHWVGAVPEQAQRLADAGVPLLAGWQPDVPGWAPFRIRHVASAPADLDPAVRPPVHVIRDQFRLTTQPA